MYCTRGVDLHVELCSVDKFRVIFLKIYMAAQRGAQQKRASLTHEQSLVKDTSDNAIPATETESVDRVSIALLQQPRSTPSVAVTGPVNVPSSTRACSLRPSSSRSWSPQKNGSPSQIRMTTASRPWESSWEHSSEASSPGHSQRPAWEDWQQKHGKSPELVLFFQNAHYASMAPKQFELSAAQKLPEEIEFYVSTKSTGQVSFPLPAEYPHKKYILTADVKLGYESAGPVYALPLDPDHIIGLRAHQIQGRGYSMPLIIHIPVTKRINRTLRSLCMTVHIPVHMHSGIHQPIAKIPVHSVGLEPTKRHWWLRLKEVTSHLISHCWANHLTSHLISHSGTHVHCRVSIK